MTETKQHNHTNHTITNHKTYEKISTFSGIDPGSQRC